MRNEDFRRNDFGKTEELTSAASILLQKGIQRFRQGRIILGGGHDVQFPASLLHGPSGGITKCGERKFTLLELRIIGLQRLHTVGAEKDNHVIFFNIDIMH